MKSKEEIKKEDEMNPKISIVIPHRIDRNHIMAVSSLASQSCQDFEIIIIPDKDHSGAPACRNSGAEIARGKYLFFCDDDIILEPNCLETMSKILDTCEDIGLVYSDYKFQGTRTGKQYGEMWDPELLKKRNYISTMSMMRKSIFDELGGFNPGLQRFQDWDLWLRFSRMDNAMGYYINKPLFTAYFDGKGISEQGRKDFFIQTDCIKKLHKINDYDISIIIPVHNQLEYTKKCLETVIENSLGQFEVIVVDDASNDGTAEWLKGQNGVRTITLTKRSGHTKAINCGAKAAKGKFFLFLNNDTLVPHNWTNRIISPLIHNMNICAVGPLTSSSASLQIIPDMYQCRMDYGPKDINGLDHMVISKREVKAVPAKITGFCMATTKFIWETIGPFDENIEAGGNEADWLLRAIAMGFTPAIHTGLYVHHYGNASYSQLGDTKQMWEKGNQYVLQKHGMQAYNHLEHDLWQKMIQGGRR